LKGSLEHELGGELRAGALSSGAVEAGAGPTREQEWDPGKHLTFFFLGSFVVYRHLLLPIVELHCSSTKKATAATPSPSSSSLCCKKNKKRRRRQRLLFLFFLLHCAIA